MAQQDFERPAVFVVDDEGAVRDQISQSLEELGYASRSFPDAQLALEALRGGERPLVMLVDLVMPYLDGVSFRRQQLADQELAKIPMVVMTTTGFDGQLMHSIGVPLLRKPIARNELAATLGRFRR